MKGGEYFSKQVHGMEAEWIMTMRTPQDNGETTESVMILSS